MSTATETIESLVKQEYKYGFVTDVETESAPPGLIEDIIRLISKKKGEPEWLLEWRLKANGVNMVELSQGVVQRTLAFDQTFLIVAALSAPAVIAGWFLRPRTPARAAH
jgi:hypothetical protein